MNKTLSTLLTAAVLFAASTTLADDKAQSAAIDYRQSTFKMVKWHIGPMAGMVKGKIDYDAASFSKNAEAIANLSKLAGNGFLINSPSKDSQAKASIWENKADFDKKMQAFVEASDNLVVAAQSNNLDTIKPAFGALGKSCKSCHKEYRLEKK